MPSGSNTAFRAVKWLKHKLFSRPDENEEADKGAIAIMMAGALSFAAAAGVMAVDVGKLYASHRALQNAADAAALASVLDLTRAQEIALASLNSNGYDETILAELQEGRYTPDPGIGVPARFNTAASNRNAVRLELQQLVDLYFLKMFNDQENQTVRVASTAANVPIGGFAVGTGVLTTDGGLISSITNALGGSSVDLSLVSWQGLANGRINVPLFFDHLATNIGFGAGTYDSLLGTEVSVGQMIDAAISAYNDPRMAPLSPDDLTALSALQVLAADGAFDVQTFPLDELMDFNSLGRQTIGAAQPGSVLDPYFSPYDVVFEALKTARAGSILGLASTITLPGLADVDLELAVGETPQNINGEPLPRIAVGPVGVSIHTAPVRLRLDVSLLNGVSSTLGLLSVNFPLYVEAAGGDAELASVSCGTEPGVDGVMGIDAQSYATAAYIGAVSDAELLNFFTPVTPDVARVVDAALIYIEGAAETEVLGSGVQNLTFTAAQIAAGEIQRIGGEETVGTLMSNLDNDLTLTPVLLGLPVPTGPIVSAVADAIGPVLTALDPLLSGSFQTLGVRPGYMDVAALGMRCGAPVLVQ